MDDSPFLKNNSLSLLYTVRIILWGYKPDLCCCRISICQLVLIYQPNYSCCKIIIFYPKRWSVSADETGFIWSRVCYSGDNICFRFGEKHLFLYLLNEIDIIQVFVECIYHTRLVLSLKVLYYFYNLLYFSCNLIISLPRLVLLRFLVESVIM